MFSEIFIFLSLNAFIYFIMFLISLKPFQILLRSPNFTFSYSFQNQTNQKTPPQKHNSKPNQTNKRPVRQKKKKMPKQ